MPNSHRIRTQLGVDKVLQINLDQDYDTLELLSFSFFPNDVYTRTCADFGVVCGRVFCNRGLGLMNARVSIFIPISVEDESNPIISTLYPYKSFVDFNEDGYKYNLLPYSPSHSGHVPVGTFPDRLDALTNQTVVEVYDKYYKFTAKTNDAGDFMIFGVPVGQYDLFMQVDLSDIGEFSLTPQDLIRMGRATEAQVAGTKFKFSENYSELPQIVTLTKVIQIAPFYGQDGICQHYITRADFDLTTEASIEILPTAIFMGSVISTDNKKKLKKRCRVPAKQGWLCNLITGPGQIETIRHTINTDIDGRPILEQYRLQNDGKLIDENGTWVVELPMNLDYVYTDEFGNRRISPDGSVGVPIRGRYRFKIKWQQAPNVSLENKRGYFLIPNIKEHGWPENARTDTSDPGLEENSGTGFFTLPSVPPLNEDDQPSPGPFDEPLNLNEDFAYNLVNTNNIQNYVVLVDGEERPDLNDTINTSEYSNSVVAVRYTLIDASIEGKLFFELLTVGQFKVQSSYAFSRSWADYGTAEMIQEAINCEDRFYEFQYNKVYTVSQLIDRYSNRIFPQKSIQIKHILDDKCEGDYNAFPTNDVYYRYDLLYITVNVILSIMKYQFFQILIFLHVLAFLWPVIAALLVLVWAIQKLVYWICLGLQKLSWRDRECNEPKPLRDLVKNPFKNLNLPLFLYTEDGCERCRCKIDPQELDEENNDIVFDLIQNLEQIDETNLSYLANFATLSSYSPWNNIITTKFASNPDRYYDPDYLTKPSYGDTYTEAVTVILAGNAAANIEYRRLPLYAGNDGNGRNFRVFSTSLTIAERLNLFNTKAKYFDNLTTISDGANVAEKIENSISPGNTGWNQVKVTWAIDDNNYNQRYHFDNLLVLVTDSQSFYKGEILSFQDPSMSNDPHVNTTTGTCLNPSYVEVKFANPNTDYNDSPILSTIYEIDISNYPETSYVAPNGDIRLGVVTSKKVCFPMDIEYFQVIQEMSYTDYLFYTRTAAPNNLSDQRFSLAWRFLRTQRDEGNGAVLKFGTLIDSLTQNINFGNGQWVYRQVDGVPSTCDAVCLYQTTHVVGNLNSWRSYFPYGETGNQSVTIFPPDPNLRVVFLQRGVDINAPDLRNRYDLRRFFGLSNNWNLPPTINHIDPNYGAQFDISDVCIVQGYFKPNIPIQPGGGSALAGFNTTKSSGFICIGVITAYNEQQQPIINTANQCLAALENDVTCVAAVLGVPQSVLPILQEATSGVYTDDNGIFEPGSSIFTAPSSLEIRISIFLKFKGQVNDTDGLEVLFRCVDDSPDVSFGFFDVTTDVQTISQTLDVSGFVSGQRYKLEYKNYTSGEIIFYADLPSWVYDNPHGLKLPKHNEFVDNSDNLFNSNNGNIFFESQFFKISQNKFTGFTSTMANYYSALDENTLFFGSGDNGWRSIYQSNLNRGGINNESIFGCTVISHNPTIDKGLPPFLLNSQENHFGYVIVPDNFDGLKIPCSVSDLIPSASEFCGNEPDLGVSTGGEGCVCSQNVCPGCCRSRRNLYERLFVYPYFAKTSLMNEVGGYWGKEYVEGGSAFSLFLSLAEDNFQRVYSTSPNCTYEGGGNPSWGGGGGACSDGCDMRSRSIYQNDYSQQYISPCYNNFPDVDPTPEFLEFFGGNIQEARKYWYVNPNHQIQINTNVNNVFRTDRLPSSTTPQGDGNGNGYLLHQNNGFSIFKINVDDCTFEQAGGGDIADPVQSSDVDYENLPDDGQYSTVANSLSNCALAVDLNSYYINENGYPDIKLPNPYSREPANLGADWVWFNRGVGCYNLVSKPLASLIPHQIPNDPENKYYWDVATVVEWIQRLKLTFAQCFEIFSHTFSNNWINGTLYAYPFQNATRFDSQNQPYREFCKDVIYFHDPTNNYYYRSSPWNGTNFVGKYRDTGDRGNLRNLQTPTTILDMGPKAAFIQEIVLSDDYDGYIVSRIPSTSFQNVTDILNLFILNRLVNTNFIQQLIPLPIDEGGNEEGSDDPSVGAMFANTRWKNGDAFFANLLPGLIDADYSQLISINSEFGVSEYSPETYTNKDIFFGEDEGRLPLIGFRGRIYSTKRPVLGIYFSGDNQLRDYISPRRTIWNQNGTIPVQDADFTEINTKTQVVPFYQWNIFHDRADPEEGPTIFGVQSNNFITDLNKPANYYTNSETFPDGFFAHGYQSLDRFGDSSEYFNPNGNDTFTYKGYIINYNDPFDTDGNFTGYTPTYQAQTNPRYRYTFGAPFHFYFGLKQGSSAMDRFISIYVDTTVIYE